MEENGHSPFNDPVADVYSYILQRAHTHMLAAGGLQAISNHSDGIAVRSSDKNGNAKGAYFNARTYSDCAVAMALMNPFTSAAQAQTTYIASGSPFYKANGVYDTAHPYSYYDLVQDFTDTLLWAQGDGSLRGAFEYILNASSGGRYDGSAQQWPALAMTMAKDVLAIDTPSWWTGNAVAATEAIMNAAGGVDYQPGQNWFNAAKTGGALSIMKANGMDTSSGDGAKLLSFVQSVWDSPGNTGSNNAGWASVWYAMYGCKKGLALQGLNTITVNGAARDWYLDLSGWLLGNPNVVASTVSPSQRTSSQLYGQFSDGHWQSSDSWVGGSLDADTSVSILVLTRSVTSPPPVPQIAAIPQQSTVGPFSIVLDGTGS
jgi:hypothetical protein